MYKRQLQDVSAGTDSVSGYGTYGVSSGTWTYTLDSSNAAVQALAASATMTDTFAVTSSDGTSQTITITITGVNDAATFGGDTTGGATEDTSDASGTATVADADTNQATFTAVSTATDSVSGYGQYTITSGGVWAVSYTHLTLPTSDLV